MAQDSPRPWSRRAVLRTAAALGAAVPVAVGGAALWSRRESAPVIRTTAVRAPAEVQSPSPMAATSTPTQAPTPTPSASPTATPTEVPRATFEFRPRDVGNGEATLLMVRAVESSGSVQFLGKTVPLRSQGNILWAILGVPVDAALGPRTAQVTLLDPSGKVSQRLDATTRVVHVERPVDYLVVTEEVGAVLTPDAGVREAQLREMEFAAFDPDVRWSKPFIKPAVGEVSTQFGSGRSINGGPIGGFHSGADIANDHGTLIVAAAPGRVSFVEHHPIRGLSVILDHGSGVTSGYHHLNSSLVRPQQMVDAGVPIAHMGSTGFSTGPHLHWEVTVYGVNVDPFTWTTEAFRA